MKSEGVKLRGSHTPASETPVGPGRHVQIMGVVKGCFTYLLTWLLDAPRGWWGLGFPTRKRTPALGGDCVES